MLSVYVPHGTTLERIVVEPGSPPPDNAVWIDMVTPTVQEDKIVEQMLGIAVPTAKQWWAYSRAWLTVELHSGAR